MPGGPYPRDLVASIYQSGANPTRALEAFRKAGGAIRTQTWYRAWGELRNQEALGQVEPSLPLGVTPQPQEIYPWTTKRARGFKQDVAVIGRNVQGDVTTMTISRSGTTLITRGNAIRKAMEVVEGITPDRARRTTSVPTTVIMGVYAGTAEMNPEG